VPNFTPGVDARVRVLTVSGSTLYAGGIFGVADNQPRTRLAAFSTGPAASPDRELVGTGEVGASYPDRQERDDQGEQHDPGCDQAGAGEAGG
jgi:hypothetical protein